MARQQAPSKDLVALFVSLVALVVSDEGSCTYRNVESDRVIRGTDIAPYLPRSIWAPTLVSAHVDPSQHCKASCARCTDDDDDSHTCPVCLETLEEGCMVSCFACSHTLHWQCANAWLTARITNGKPGTCPLWYAPCHPLNAI